MKKISRSHHSTLNELNITPLLDLAFVLLVIFIITTPQMMNNLEMALPSGQPPTDAPKPIVHRIEVHADGQIFLDGNSSPLKPALQKLKTAEPDLHVVVKADDEADYQKMVSVLDILQQLDITKIGLATQSEAAAK